MVTFVQPPIILTAHNVMARNTQLYVAASTHVSYTGLYDKVGWYALVQVCKFNGFRAYMYVCYKEWTSGGDCDAAPDVAHTSIEKGLHNDTKQVLR